MYQGGMQNAQITTPNKNQLRCACGPLLKEQYEDSGTVEAVTYIAEDWNFVSRLVILNTILASE